MRPRTDTSGCLTWLRAEREAVPTQVSGRTKQEVRDKIKALHAKLDRGLRTSSTYTVRQAVDDWLDGGLPGGQSAHGPFTGRR
jgi:hypothetical protein